MPSLKSLRKQIDETDRKIVGLLNKRASIILSVGGIKNASGSSAYCPDREREVLTKITALSKGPFDRKALTAIYREIMSASIALEKRLRVAYMGPEASFSHQAALKRFGSLVDFVSCDNIADVFLQVEKGTADHGVVPVENSIEGAVNYTLDMFMDSDLKICAQVILDISHSLLSRSNKGSIRRIYSNPQVFGQCRGWLRDNLPKAELVDVSSTSKAAQLAAKEKGAAAIGSALGADMYGLRVIARSIEDSPHNITKFFVIGKTDVPGTGRDRTSLMFSIKDRVGALHEMLMPFKRYGVNLSKIESRPSKRKAWEYYFFVDLEGHVDEPAVRKSLAALETKCKFLKVLGSYPVGE
ncbi:MAG: prephenate dehydratase [Deltaproteobacteria bacterium]